MRVYQQVPRVVLGKAFPQVPCLASGSVYLRVPRVVHVGRPLVQQVPEDRRLVYSVLLDGGHPVDWREAHLLVGRAGARSPLQGPVSLHPPDNIRATSTSPLRSTTISGRKRKASPSSGPLSFLTPLRCLSAFTTPCGTERICRPTLFSVLSPPLWEESAYTSMLLVSGDCSRRAARAES